MEQPISVRMDFFGELIACGQNLFYWEFDPKMELVRTSCPTAEHFQGFFPLSGCQDYLLRYLKEGNTAPLVLSDVIEMSWIADFELLEGQICRIYLIGPVFTSDIPVEQISARLRQYNFSASMSKHFQEHIFSLPVIPHASWLQFGLMLHYTVTGEKIGISDFVYQSESGVLVGDDGEPVPTYPKGGTYLAEQAAMRMVEQGNLDYGSVFDRLASSAQFSIQIKHEAATRDMKNAVISFITMVTRAAIRGGLDVESAYFLGGLYIRQVEQAGTFTELMRINATAYDDFVHRVHKVQKNSGVSPAVRQCCEYIELHITEKLSLKQLAEKTGYAANYLAQKFKREMGCTVTQYINRQKVEQAKRLLRSDARDVQGISETLGFCNPSYFSETFRAVTGMTPGEFRQKGK